MSANNWATCPRCKKRHEALVVAAVGKADAAYGKVPLEQWKEMVAAADLLDVPFTETTFREDYEVYGAESGVVKISYNGNCSVCRLGLTFDRDMPIEGIDQ